MPNNWLWPVGDHAVGTAFGAQGSQWSSGSHTGVDFTAAGGSPVQAVSGGRVVLARTASAGSPYGNYVIVDHGNGRYSLYAHLSGFNVQVGQQLKAGQHIGQVGETGNAEGAHLHFEIRKGSNWMYPESAVDPNAFLERKVGNDAGGGGGGAAERGAQDANGKDKDGYGNYGYVKAFTNKHPAIAALIDQARKEGWTPERLAYEIKDTKWWRTHTEDQRKWQLLSAESRAEAKKQIQDRALTISQMAGAAGVQLSNKELNQLAERAARNGWDDADIQLALSRSWDGLGKKDEPQSGMVADATLQIDQMVADYGIPLDRKTRERWIRRTLKGEITPEDMEDRFREQAKTLYPNAGNLLNTQTLREVLSPYLSAAAEELGIPPEQMNLRDGKWTQALAGKNGLMTLDEWQRTYRSDKRYGWDNSAMAKGVAASLAGDLGRMMGNTF